jgi:dGTPase
MRSATQTLKTFLFHALYRHPQVVDTMDRAKQVVQGLFDAYIQDPQAMQSGTTQRSSAPSEMDVPRQVSDYIAGMTDRFAAREHERLTGLRLLA